MADTLHNGHGGGPHGLQKFLNKGDEVVAKFMGGAAAGALVGSVVFAGGGILPGAVVGGLIGAVAPDMVSGLRNGHKY